MHRATVSTVYRDPDCAALPEVEVIECGAAKTIRRGCARFVPWQQIRLGSLVHVEGFALYPLESLLEFTELIQYGRDGD